MHIQRSIVPESPPYRNAGHDNNVIDTLANVRDIKRILNVPYIAI